MREETVSRFDSFKGSEYVKGQWDEVKLTAYGKTGIVDIKYGFHHFDGVTSTHPGVSYSGHPSGWAFESIICNIETARSIYDYNVENLRRTYSKI